MAKFKKGDLVTLTHENDHAIRVSQIIIISSDNRYYQTTSPSHRDWKGDNLLHWMIDLHYQKDTSPLADLAEILYG